MNNSISHDVVILASEPDPMLSALFVNHIFRKKGGLKRHIGSVHELKKPFKCPVYDSCFPEKDPLNRHIASVHEERKPFKCSVCESYFSQKKEFGKTR